MSFLARLRRLATRDLLMNAASMIGTTVITAGLGFVYWWLAARQFSQEAVGFASALISAMSLLGTLGMIGMGTLLIGELPRQTEHRATLITTALVAAGGVSAALGIIFALIAPLVSVEFRPLAGGASTVLLFTAGVVLTAVTLVLDQAMIGLLRGELQLWRNAIFALGKLAILWLMGLWVASGGGVDIYTTWTLGNAVSIVGLGLIAAMAGAHYTRWPAALERSPEPAEGGARAPCPQPGAPASRAGPADRRHDDPLGCPERQLLYLLAAAAPGVRGPIHADHRIICSGRRRARGLRT